MSTKAKEVGLKGDLKTVSLGDLLQLISTSGKTGMLSVFRPKGSVSKEIQKREIYFQKGYITYASSFGGEDELLGKLILRKRKISKADLEKAVSLQKISNKRLGEVLFEMGILSKEELMEFLKYQIEEIVYNLFGWSSGEFVFLEEKLPSTGQITTQINTMNMVMEGSRRIDEWNRIRKFLPADDVMLKAAADPKIKSDKVSVHLDDLQTLLLVNGERTIPEILELSSIGEFLTSKALYNLLNLGVIEEGDKKKIKRSEREEERLLFEMIVKLYALACQEIEKIASQKLGEGAKKILSNSLHLQKINHPLLDSLVSSQDFLDFGKLRDTVTRMPRQIRFHKLMDGLNALLGEFLRTVSLTLGKNLDRQVIAQIKKGSAHVIAQEREVAKRYELEEELFRILKQVQ
jgi:hypothetical protein